MEEWTGLRVSLIFPDGDNMRTFAEYIIGYRFYTYVLMFLLCLPPPHAPQWRRPWATSTTGYANVK